ncbi:DUF58 domain-containing protein [Halorubrum sp. CBA1125]|uniref:DUF58 domain-containing protein n=1 Tax=Halorubrum sp. CBA1125 TaxID=2668072 RepID=UPI00135E089D|nr:DUF58 domain-containing protein [Halorubrum sp. CBA1125]MUW14040.1 DUF58 domain-containing protein [Halorubrum sp. CBA1125]
MNYRRLASLVGIAALGFSLITIVYPGLVAFSLGPSIVSGIGVLALVQALRVVQTRRHESLDEAATPDPELPVGTASPGDELETVLNQFLGSRRTYYHRTRIREGLRSAAVSVLTQYEAYTATEAEEAVTAGTWTDDRYAAAFLGGENAPSPPLRPRLRGIVRREAAFNQGVRRTVDAIAAMAGAASGTTEGTVDIPRRRDSGRANAGADPPQIQYTTATGDEMAQFDDETEAIVSRVSHSTGHWRGVSAVALVGIGVGILVEQPAVLLAGAVGIGFAAYARSAVLSPDSLPPGSVSVSRTLGADRPEPGDDVEVTVTVTNESDRVLPDLRLVDGVPEALAVANGSPRVGTALRPGRSTTFTYTVTARRGVHTFGPTALVARDLTGSVEQERLLRAETTLACVPSLRPLGEPVPLRERATQYVGRVETRSGGDGLEFHATREYRPGDPMSRIDWNRRARTGELTTVEFREERAATVVIVIDARETAYVSPARHTPHAVDRAVDAAGRLFATLSDSGDRVGIAAVGSEPCWLAPGSGVDHRVKARDLLATHRALTPVPTATRSTTSRSRKQLRKRLSPGTQIIFITPLCDEYGGRFARRLDEYGYPVTVVAPDPTVDRAVGHRLSRVARTLRLTALRRAGIPVVDWSWDESVDVALARHNERGSR